MAAAGIITDRVTGRPVTATVSFDGVAATAHGDGGFSITGLPANSALMLSIFSPGYENVSEEIIVRTSDLRLDRELTPLGK